jgi:diadenosine tetraphosphate (Ap4A) HIT family hydrolase
MVYDEDNTFAKILRGEIPCNRVYEDDFALAFRDVRPQAPVHVLVIPKGAYSDASDFATNAPKHLILGFYQAVAQTAQELGLASQDKGNGYRLIANAGADGRQEVPHFHVHIMGGGDIGPMVSCD